MLQLVYTLFTLGSIWGLIYTLTKIVLETGMSPLVYAWWQTIGATLLLVLLCWVKKIPLKLSSEYRWFYFLCAVFGVVIPNINMYYLAPHLPAGLMATLVNTVPILIYVLALMFSLEKFKILRASGVLVGMAGILFLVSPHFNLMGEKLGFRVILALITPISFAISAIYMAKRRPEDANTISITTGMLIISSIVISVMLAFKGGINISTADVLSKRNAVLLISVCLSGLGYVLLFHLIKLGGAVYYSLVNGIVIVAGIFWGWFFLSESLHLWFSVGMLLILLGIGMVSIQQKEISPQNT